MSDEEKTSMTSTTSKLEREKRAIVRSLTGQKSKIAAMLVQNPSTDLVEQINAHLESFAHDLETLSSKDHTLFHALDTTKYKTEEALENAETAITKDYEALRFEYNEAKGKCAAMAVRLERESRSAPSGSRQSLGLNTTFADGALASPLAKLPDIKVPKFNGKLANFTEWHSLFVAMVDSNEALKPVHKLYYLKEAMIESAATLLRDYPLSEGMYEPAFDYVKERYFNKRAIIAEHFRELLDMPALPAPALRESLDKLQAIVRGLKTCGIDTAKMSPIIAFIVSRKLPERLRQDWENSHHDYSTYPSFEPLAKFLSNRCFAYESGHPADITKKAVAPPKVHPAHGKSDTSKPKATLTTVSQKTHDTRDSRKCLCCGGERHFLSWCPEYEKKNLDAKHEFVMQNRLCYNCLRPGHGSIACNSSPCKKCGGKHNTTLHRDDSNSGPAPTPAATPRPSGGTPQASLSMVKHRSLVLLPSAVIRVRLGKKGVLTRALIDSCSQVSLVTENFIRKNRLKTHTSTTNILGVSPAAVSPRWAVDLTVESRYSDYQITLEADVIGSLPYNVDMAALKQVQNLDPHLNFADQGLDSTGVDVLIGARFASRILLDTRKFFEDVCLQESRFGWIVEGPLPSRATLDSKCCCLSVQVEDVLSKFWEIEEVTPPKLSLSDHELCETHFESTHTRLEDGRFEVRLPFKATVSNIANTYGQARSALLRSERKLDSTTRALYKDFMKEYRDLGHMQRVSDTADVENRFYIPHLPVLRPDSTTTKLRVVFNASATANGKMSLNQALLNGPTLQPELVDILVKFRMHSVAFSADISKMYRQVSVHPLDRHYQTILWRDDPHEKLQVYELTTLTYGTTPAAYIATKCLQIISRSLHEDPEISNAIGSEFYMDDLLTGSADVKSAVTKARKIHDALLGAKFPLRKYVSNSSEFLRSLDSSLVEKLQPVSFETTGTAKILGLRWFPEKDEFRICCKLEDITHVTSTKRVVASLIASLFDPLGFANPVLVRGKILLQDLWRQEMAWDDPIPENLDVKFREYYDDLRNLPKFSIPRAYSHENFTEFVLYGFSDASTLAYGAVVYIRPLVAKNVRPIIVCAKSKVAPLKEIKVPRLELLGAVLLTQLVSRVAKVLNHDLTNVRAYCDSTIVLAWLKGPASKYETFVRNRVEYVTSRIPYSNWSYVATKENPADLVTRGISVNALADSQLWLHGPPWLALDTRVPVEIVLPEAVPETRKNRAVLVLTIDHDERIISLSSSYDRLMRIIAHALVFVKKLRSRKHEEVSTQTATEAAYRISQMAWFRSEIEALRLKRELPTRSALSSLDPFLDNGGVLRIGGRLRNSALSYDAKFPVLLHSRSALALLIARHIHEKYFHATRSFVTGFLQRKFWLINGVSSLVKRVFYECVWCTRMKADTAQQVMGDLPWDRTYVSRPFTTSGVDFAGPFTIRCTNHRTTRYLRHYAAFFVCMVTRAVHIESVADLSAESFIAAFQRFIARRGIPRVMWSDNATNFVGANNELARIKFSEMKWNFIPARSPHHGGIWEAAVKAGKKHLLASVRDTIMTEDQFKTTLATIESILNSRPLYQRRRTTDLDVIDVLTPGHFLVGSHLLEPDKRESSIVSLSERDAIQRQVISSFWTNWSKSYLATLQTRTKWKRLIPNLEVGDVVVIKEMASPSNWPLGVIVKGQPDQRGRLRIVTVRARGTEYQRSVQQLVKLPVERDRKEPLSCRRSSKSPSPHWT